MKQCLIIGMALMAWAEANGTGMYREDDDEYDVWEPVYTITSGEAPVCEDATGDDFALSDAILGKPQVDAHAIWQFVRRHNPDFQIEIAEAFISLGETYGIRGDVALCQAIIETGWFRFADGTAVTPDQHNYCGLGVTRRGVRGHAFETIEEGVRAHLQHLYAYACTSPLPPDEPLTDPRFSLVKRGVAPTWTELSNRWAMNPSYGRQIMELYSRLLQHSSVE